MYENSAKQILEAQQGNKRELEKLINQNNGLIWSIVKRFLGRGYASEDLYQIGCIGFIKSIKRFDTDFEVKLSTYAVPYILGEIKRFLRDDGMIKVSRNIKELGVKIKELQKHHLITKGKEITLNEISKELNISKEEISLVLESYNTIESLDGATKNSDDSDKQISILDKISSNKNEEEALANKITVREMIKKLNKKEQEIILLRYYKDMTQSEVAKIVGITQVQVSRIEKKVLGKMKLELIS